MNYRPITDVWILARAKLKGGVKYYGAFLGGFGERARALLGCSINDPVLHVCSGMVKLYPYKRAFGPNDKTLDLDPVVDPDFLQDAREPWPDFACKAVLIDPPYSEEDAARYTSGAATYPSPNLLVKRAFEILPPGGRCGILHYIWPSPPKEAILVAAVGVLCGYNNRIRIFSVFERPA